MTREEHVSVTGDPLSCGCGDTEYASYELERWGLTIKTAGPEFKSLVHVLCIRGDVHGKSHPSQKLLAQESDQSERSVRDLLPVMEACGLITRYHRYVYDPKKGKRVRTSDQILLHARCVPMGTDFATQMKKLRKKTAAKDGVANHLPADLAGSSGDLPADLAGSSTDHLPADPAGRSNGSNPDSVDGNGCQAASTYRHGPADLPAENRAPTGRRRAAEQPGEQPLTTEQPELPVPHDSREPAEPDSLLPDLVPAANGKADRPVFVWMSSTGDAVAAPAVSPWVAGKGSKGGQCPCPDPFPVTVHMKAWAEAKAPNVEVEFHTAQFVRRHLARGDEFKGEAGWTQAWYGWLSNAQRWGQHGSGQRKAPQPPNMTRSSEKSKYAVTDVFA